MIKTSEAVSYNTVDLSLKDIVFAEVISTNRNDILELYTIYIREWRNEVYTENIPNDNGDMILKEFTKQHEVRRTNKTISFLEADQLTNIVDSMFPSELSGSSLRKHYTNIGHLLTNNNENVRNVNWELVN